MAYRKKQLAEQALKAITEENIVFFEEISHFLPVSRRTLYNKRLHEMHAIKEALDYNRVNLKRDLRNQWQNKDTSHPATQIALYKLVASDDELERLQPRKSQVELSQSEERPLIPDPVARMIEKAYKDELDSDTNEDAGTDTD